jgi:ribosomal protein L37AE/L43A
MKSKEICPLCNKEIKGAKYYFNKMWICSKCYLKGDKKVIHR